MLLSPNSTEDIKTVFIYVDGGYHPNPPEGTLAQCTWGLCVITEHIDGSQVLQGCVGGWGGAGDNNNAYSVSGISWGIGRMWKIQIRIQKVTCSVGMGGGGVYNI